MSESDIALIVGILIGVALAVPSVLHLWRRK